MIRIGTSGWSYDDWIGNFYPEQTKKVDFLASYARRFSTVEIDSSFYGIPRVSTVEKWYDSVPDDFKFSAKFPKQITHESNLKDIDEVLKKFLDAMSVLKEKLGPLLLQFPYSFKPEMASDLNRFFKILPREFEYVIEVRNKKWFDESFYDSLRENGIGLAVLDHPWMPKLRVVTSKILYVRFLGDRKQIPDDFTHEHIDRGDDLKAWKILILALEEKVDDFYGYFNNHYSGHSPTTAQRFLEMLR